ncbi:ferric reductase family protein [Aspergillus clavatus NRRL 1]|uniref:Metalloreductase, putative n=1 Tax=Aspergillus clavatus (strain ATCC 1007 / CBS 513.65 / DSM 816 / NCTC 3887 / NRRL 1 / QM 1276 / 107) TaxID=344612 RepID=A1C8X0_ASPCL|nr:metalloreductase, putative [Aspergillus clavatus NRRL 1]EAW13757.1 metalloreductase, putative [Aspergillus clavatus NRRL 1]
MGVKDAESLPSYIWFAFIYNGLESRPCVDSSAIRFIWSGGVQLDSKMLNPAEYDFSNRTEAAQFLDQLLKGRVFHEQFVPRLHGFWYAVIIVVCIAGIWQLLWRFHLRSRRLQAGRALSPSSQIVSRVYKLALSATRKVVYPQWSPVSTTSWFIVPPLGTTGFILSYFLFLLLLLFVDIQVTGPTWYTNASVRAAFLATIQIPLLLSLVGKNNIVSLMTGISYERLNIYHRWVARGCFLMATLHFALLGGVWSQFSGLTALAWDTNKLFRSGIVPYVFLAWMNISSVLPLRDWCYEFFLFQHVLTFFGFIITVAIHIPKGPQDAFHYIYVGIALYLGERLISGIRFAYHNSRLSHATLEPLPGSTTRIRVSNCRIKSWTPGAHALISLPTLKIGQSHPATILSTPTSHNGDIVFLLRAYRGFTMHLHEAAKAAPRTIHAEEPEKQLSAQLVSYRALINGPYAASHADFGSFDTVYLVAGAAGVTFTLSILLDLAHRAASAQERERLPLRRIEFVWMVRKETWLSWISDELSSAARCFASAGITFAAHIYVTSEVSFASSSTVDVPVDDENRGEADDGESSTSPEMVKPKVSPSWTLHPGRPDWRTILPAGLAEGAGESAVGVCGPLNLSMAIRNQVASMGGQIYLHVESFS